MTRTQQIILLVLLVALAVAQYLLREGYLKPWSLLTGQALASGAVPVPLLIRIEARWCVIPAAASPWAIRRRGTHGWASL
jgi:hypothetical protein